MSTEPDADPPPDTEPQESERTAGQDRARKFHEATGSLRDLGIAILILVLMFVVVYVLFLR